MFATSSTAPRIGLNQLSAVHFSAVISVHKHNARALVRTAQSWVTPLATHPEH